MIPQQKRPTPEQLAEAGRKGKANSPWRFGLPGKKTKPIKPEPENP